jgi:hypothetical protein
MGSAVVGFLVGMTGLGGGALMTPMLVLIFGIAPSAAISSDLIAALFMKPFGVAIHWKRKTVQSGIVKLLCIGSVPMAFLGTYVMHLMGNSATAERDLEILLGTALIFGATAMIVRSFLPGRHRQTNKPLVLRKYPTIAIGAVGGFMVGLTSVGAGSMILVLLLMVYPNLKNHQLVGTDLAQSIFPHAVDHHWQCAGGHRGLAHLVKGDVPDCAALHRGRRAAEWTEVRGPTNPRVGCGGRLHHGDCHRDDGSRHAS